MKLAGINEIIIAKDSGKQYHIQGQVRLKHDTWPQKDKYNKLIKIDVTDDSEELYSLLEEFVSALDYLGLIKESK